MPFSLRDISDAAEPAGELDLDALGPAVHRLLHGLLHRPAEARPLLELLGDVLADQLGVDLGPGDLDDLDLDPPAGQVLQLLGSFSIFSPFLPMITPPGWTVTTTVTRLAGPLDLDLGDAGEAPCVLLVGQDF